MRCCELTNEFPSLFFRRPKSLLKAPRKVDFFRCGVPLLLSVACVASLTTEYRTVLDGSALLWPWGGPLGTGGRGPLGGERARASRLVLGAAGTTHPFPESDPELV